MRAERNEGKGSMKMSMSMKMSLSMLLSKGEETYACVRASRLERETRGFDCLSSNYGQHVDYIRLHTRGFVAQSCSIESSFCFTFPLTLPSRHGPNESLRAVIGP